MAKVFLRRTLTGFAAADEASAETCRKYKVGEVYKADIVKPRSYQHHKLCMALLSLTWANLPDEYSAKWPTFDVFRKAVARAAGHLFEYVSVDGEIVTEAGSLSYDALDEAEFSLVMPAMMTVCAHLLHDMALSELEAQVAIYADEKYGRAA